LYATLVTRVYKTQTTDSPTRLTLLPWVVTVDSESCFGRRCGIMRYAVRYLDVCRNNDENCLSIMCYPHDGVRFGNRKSSDDIDDRWNEENICKSTKRRQIRI